MNNASGVTFNTDGIIGTQLAGGTFQYLGAATGSAETVGVLTPTAGHGKVIVTPGASGTTSLIFGSLGTRGAGATLSFASGTGAGVQFLTAPAGSNGAIGGFATITDPATGAVDFVATPTASTNITALASAVALPAVDRCCLR
jgi:hypothetical protein